MPTPGGDMIIGSEPATGTGAALVPTDPHTGAALEPGYPAAGPEQVDLACSLAAAAAADYRATTVPRRARFLERIADLLDDRADAVVARAHAETALPVARLTGEVARTTGQLRLFATELRTGVWQGARIDPGAASPARPDIRARKVPLGPVAVFGASNFPLAFSTAGGDTASALAAGCPVVVKAHEAHLGTAELAARAVADAARDTGMPDGVFSQLVGTGPEVGTRLVSDPRIRAVGFTGSRAAGLAIAAVAAARPVPIPVFAEMSSVNPVLLLPGALAARGAALGGAFAASLLLGAGQFCTNPGLVLAVAGPGLDAFTEQAVNAVTADGGSVMLGPGTAATYTAAADALAARPGVAEISRGAGPTPARLLAVEGKRLLDDAALQSEVFGATSLLVRCADVAELTAAVATLEGQLTATVHAEPSDHPLAAELLSLLEERAGRILFDGWPTGVTVGHAMVHGGPFPSTSDPRSTSVGTAAIDRFLRPVAYQDVPDALLPAVLRDANPDGAWRRVDGEPTRDAR